jgi:cytochrome c
MSTPNRIGATIVAAALVGACATQMSGSETTSRQPNLGRVATAEEVAAWDISIAPSGAGLPKGGGSARQGLQVYEQKCLACHGAKGVGKPADVLVGGVGSLASKAPLRTVGSYWPYATTLFDYVRRAMPIANPLSLSDDEVYAVSAYVLFLNGIVDEDAQMNAQTLPQVKMPNRDGFISDWPVRPR